MTNEEILREINSLPVEAQRQIKDFIAFLRERYKSAPPEENAKVSDLETGEFIGMWQDREDFDDNAGWRHLSAKGLQAAYGSDEPEYSLAHLKEANPEYDGR